MTKIVQRGAIALALLLVATTAHAGIRNGGPIIRGDSPNTTAPVMTSPAETAAPSEPSTLPASNFPARGPGDLYARKVPLGIWRESDEAWRARCVDHVDKDPITWVSTYRYKAGVTDCP